MPRLHKGEEGRVYGARTSFPTLPNPGLEFAHDGVAMGVAEVGQHSDNRLLELTRRKILPIT